MELSKDLMARQEARNLCEQALKAQQILSQMSQEQLDAICKAVAESFQKEAASLAKQAVAETGFGNEEDKTEKNRFASKTVYEAIKDRKCVGVLKEDAREKLWEVGVPVGVIGAIVPSTNPTSTVCYKALIALKSGNAIVFSPHPKAINCTLHAVQVVAQAARQAGAPEGGSQLPDCRVYGRLSGADGGTPGKFIAGYRRSGYGKSLLFFRETGHRCGGREWPCLYSPKCGYSPRPFLYRKIQKLRLWHHLRIGTEHYRGEKFGEGGFGRGKTTGLLPDE